MKKLVFFLLCLSGATFFLGSCKSKQAKEALNDSIQGTFFGVPFGADKDELVNNFAEHDLIPNVFISTDEMLVFQPIGGQRFTFGGLNWEILNVGLSNGKFCAIIFYNTLKDKAEAIQNGQSLYETVAAKYNLTKEEPRDTTTYMIYRGKSKKEAKREVAVFVSRYEGMDKTIYYGTFLQYSDEKFKAPVSDEL